MLKTLALVLALVTPAVASSIDPVPYEALVSAEAEAAEHGFAPDVWLSLDEDQRALAVREADWMLSARMYHAGGGGATGNDSLGCRPIAMRTVAIDPRVVPRRTRLFIKETVGLVLADGTIHDGYWYASDTGGAIKGNKIDLYTGHGRGSMAPVTPLNMRSLTVVRAGTFDVCPPAWD